jgi:hypothetical protein
MGGGGEGVWASVAAEIKTRASVRIRRSLVGIFSKKEERRKKNEGGEGG